MILRRGLALAAAGLVAEAAFLAIYWLYFGRGGRDHVTDADAAQGPEIP
jgi:hypothetical protein